jgi:hypothetical protein
MWYVEPHMRLAALILCAIPCVPTFAGCASDACKSKPASFQLDIIADSTVSMNARSLRVTLTIGNDHWRNTYNLATELADGNTSIAVTLDSQPTTPFSMEINVQAFDQQDGNGNLIAQSTGQFNATPDGCNHLQLPINAFNPGTDAGQPDSTSASDANDGGVNPDAMMGGHDAMGMDAIIPDMGPPDVGVSFPYDPSNVTLGDVANIGQNLDLNCDARFDTEAGGVGAFTNACGQQPPPVFRMPEGGGASISVVVVRGLTIESGGSLTVTGQHPVVFLVYGNADISGSIDVGARLNTSGPGARIACDPSNGQPGQSNGGSGGGGGGAGLGGQGANGGQGAAGGPAGQGGGTSGNDNLIPLRGGCVGGAGANGTNPSGQGGGGGGGLQISVAQSLTVSGQIISGGGGGRGGSRHAGAGGGGSGGGILLEGNDVTVNAGATVAATGGGGGEGGPDQTLMPPGANGGDGASQPGMGGVSGTGGGGGSGGSGGGLGGPLQGFDGTFNRAGGGGGGGAAGRIHINTVGQCTAQGAVIPTQTSNHTCM